MATRAVPSFKTSIDLSETTRTQMIDLLNQNLADLADLYSQTKQAHWNVKGIHFIELHKLFDELAEGVLEYVDMVAERATSLGGYAMGTARMAAASSRLEEFPIEVTDGAEAVKILVSRYATAAANVRSAIDTADDAGEMSTADLFTEISRALDKNLWFLEAHIQG
ncbi:MAG: DNA starvation/stationary phase protection protein Dps [Anaerolineae bacterium]|nr:DNA starvation/stationary phase protection protein Dps [Anaerolineae bacterium]